MIDQEFISKSEEETIFLATEFVKLLKPADIVCLHGNLGSGKTTFTKGIAKALGVESRIISPTFIVVRRHQAHNNQGIHTLYHLDLYRLEDEKQAKEIDLQEFINDPNGITVIEWPEVGGNIIDRKVWKVTFERADEDARRIIVSHG